MPRSRANGSSTTSRTSSSSSTALVGPRRGGRRSPSSRRAGRSFGSFAGSWTASSGAWASGSRSTRPGSSESSPASLRPGAPGTWSCCVVSARSTVAPLRLWMTAAATGIRFSRSRGTSARCPPSGRRSTWSRPTCGTRCVVSRCLTDPPSSAASISVAPGASVHCDCHEAGPVAVARRSSSGRSWRNSGRSASPGTSGSTKLTTCRSSWSSAPAARSLFGSPEWR
mmetsp:Transcript_43230/g.92256  ORF Transcript_43230/g.92256 Transcript_43230/m.92256 type:complete len:226 (+) Transcript_43230:482-1159(+)